MDIEESYKELVVAAQEYARDHWVKTGDMPPQDNAIVALLYLKVKQLEDELKASKVVELKINEAERLLLAGKITTAEEYADVLNAAYKGE